MPFSIVCVAPGASEAQVIELANSIGKGWWEFDTLPTSVSEWWRKELLELKSRFLYKLFHWAEAITGCRGNEGVRSPWGAAQDSSVATSPPPAHQSGVTEQK